MTSPQHRSAFREDLTCPPAHLQLPALLAGSQPAAAWLNTLSSALLALDLALDADLLQVMLQVS